VTRFGQNRRYVPPEEGAGAEAVQQDDRRAAVAISLHVHRSWSGWNA
jgi:hypothetical protein